MLSTTLAGIIVVAAAGTVTWEQGRHASSQAALGAPTNPLLVIVNDLREIGLEKVETIRLPDALAQTFGKNPPLVHETLTGETPIDLIETGRRMGAEMVLLESLRKTGTQFRVVSQLIQCSSGKILRVRADLLPSLAADQWRRVLVAMKSEMGTGATMEKPTQPNAAINPEVEHLVERAEEFYARRTRIDNNNAISLYKQALSLEPLDEKAMAGLAKAANANYFLWGRDPRWAQEGRAAAERTLTANPFSAGGHQAMGDYYFAQGLYPQAQEEYYQVLEIDPRSATCNAKVGMCWREQGHPRRGLPLMIRAAQLDPSHGAYDAVLGETYMLVADDQAAEASLRKSLLFDPDQPSALSSLAVLYLWQKQWKEAALMSSDLTNKFPDFEYRRELTAEVAFFSGDSSNALVLYQDLASRGVYTDDSEYFGAVNPASAVACLLQDGGETAQAQSMLDHAIDLDNQMLVRHPNNARVIHDLAAAWTLKGETETALKLLGSASANGWVEWRSTVVDPRFQKLRGDAQFKKLVSRLTPPRG